MINKKRKDISVIVTTRNRKYEVARALRSVKSQKYSPTEIIVVDDGSTDGTRDYLSCCDLGDYKYCYMGASVNHSVGNSRNEGIRNSKGEWIVFLDSDDIWYDNYLEDICDAISIYDNVSIIASNYYRCDRERKSEVFQYDENLCCLVDGAVAASFTAYKRDVFDKIGFFDVNGGLFTDYLWLNNAIDSCGVVAKKLNTLAGEQWVMYDGLLGREEMEPFRTQMRDDSEEALLPNNFDGNSCKESNIEKPNEDIASISNLLNRQKSFYQMMSSWVRAKTDGKNIAGKLYGIGAKRIAIYGAGKHGKMLAMDLNDSGIEVAGFLDKNENATGVNGIRVYLPQDFDFDVNLIIVSVFTEFEAVMEELKQICSVPCIPMDELILVDDLSNQPICDTIPLINRIVDECQSENYSDYMSDYASDEGVFRNLSDFSSTIVRWYPFKENSRILELNAGFGARTGALCDEAETVVCVVDSENEAKIIKRRYRKRRNLTVKACDVFDLDPSIKYDYIIAFGTLSGHAESTGSNIEDYVKHLSAISRYLKPNGIILLQEENIHGISKICGERSSLDTTPFGYISKTNTGINRKGFLRKELQSIVEKAGFTYNRFYYPVFDSTTPRIIFTDDHLPDNRVFERYESYFFNSGSIVADDKQLLRDFMINGTFGFHSNDFIVEMSKENVLSGLNYATISSNRTRDMSFSVGFFDNNIVRKKCLFPETIEYALKLCDDAEYLNSRGIPTLRMKYANKYMDMKHIDSPVLQDHIRELVNSKINKCELIAIFDKLWEYILVSSEHSSICEIDTKGIDAGAILKKAFIEMIPLNCFYNNGEFLFFDQEFVKDNYPANYVMMRAIRNTYAFIDGIEEILPKVDICYRYGIPPRLWDIYLKTDDNWLNEINKPLNIIRNHRVNIEQVKINQQKLC